MFLARSTKKAELIRVWIFCRYSKFGGRGLEGPAGGPVGRGFGAGGLMGVLSMLMGVWRGLRDRSLVYIRACLTFSYKVWSFLSYVSRKQTRAVSTSTTDLTISTFCQRTQMTLNKMVQWCLDFVKSDSVECSDLVDYFCYMTCDRNGQIIP